jgi:hypothetical protein
VDGSLRCSFCGRRCGHRLGRVKKLIAGPGVYICDRCIGLCTDILEMERTPRRWPGRAPICRSRAASFCAGGWAGDWCAVRAIGRACGMQQPPCLDTRECAADPAIRDTPACGRTGDPDPSGAPRRQRSMATGRGAGHCTAGYGPQRSFAKIPGFDPGYRLMMRTLLLGHGVPVDREGTVFVRTDPEGGR